MDSYFIKSTLIKSSFLYLPWKRERGSSLCEGIMLEVNSCITYLFSYSLLKHFIKTMWGFSVFIKKFEYLFTSPSPNLLLCAISSVPGVFVKIVLYTSWHSSDVFCIELINSNGLMPIEKKDFTFYFYSYPVETNS